MSGGISIQVNGGIGMSAEDGGRGRVGDRSIETFVDGVGFLGAGNDGENLFGFEDLADGHGDGAGGNRIEIGEPTFADLLAAAGFVERDDDVGLVGVEIGGGIVESEMAILADADEGDVDGSGSDGGGGAANDVGGIFFAVEEMNLSDAGFGDESILKEFAEASGMSHGQADVFVEVEKFNARPVDAGSSDEGVEKFELRGGASADDAGFAVDGDGALDGGGGLGGGGLAE